jgi:hypothetical protein
MKVSSTVYERRARLVARALAAPASSIFIYKRCVCVTITPDSASCVVRGVCARQPALVARRPASGASGIVRV